MQWLVACDSGLALSYEMQPQKGSLEPKTFKGKRTNAATTHALCLVGLDNGRQQIDKCKSGRIECNVVRSLFSDVAQAIRGRMIE
jgi:hypothetical protein